MFLDAERSPMHYYRVIDGPTPLTTYNGQTVEYFTILPEGEGLEGDVPVIGCEKDLSDHQGLTFIKMISVIDIKFGDKNYEYRSQIQGKDEEGNLQQIVLEVENGGMAFGY